MLKTFSFTGARKIVFGCGSFSGLAAQVRDLRAKKPFVAIDGNLAKLGMRDRITEIFDREGMKSVLYDGVLPEPPLEQADEGARLVLKGKCDIVIGIGGGSAMDVAKAVAVVAAHGAEAKDFLGLNRVPGPGLPTIMVPTTAGTGSEVTFTAVFVRPDLRKKEGMNSVYMYPDLALLDPELTLSLPPQPTAASGMDALCHAIESYTSVIASPASEMFSLEAIRLIAENLRTCVHNGKDLEAREAQLLGSLYAGIGLANAGVGAAHSLSYPLGGKYGISHGVANTLMLPRIMEYNLPGALEKFALVAEVMGENTEGLSVRDAAMLAVEAVDALIEDCGIATGLEELGIPEEDFPEMARVAMTVARPLENNPRKVTLEDAIEIYRTAM
ncbi:MAG TPA: iron-containing alcohol dehydrogenase [Syntrophales bacterium]|nr:iron-containing alcohol dehydrogenase [Syntrophales bacterium]